MIMNPLVIAIGVLLAVTAIPYVSYLALYALVRPKGSPAEKEPWEPTVTIVLSTYNKADIIAPLNSSTDRDDRS